MSKVEHFYPDFFPSGCPPRDAKTIELKVYRLVGNDQIDEKDFKSFIEEGRDQRNPKLPFVEYGLSVNPDYEELKTHWRSVGALKKKYKNIASGITYKDTGVVKPTPSKVQKSHHTWWLCKNAVPEKYFKIVR
ncbi:hypothetical protein JSQ81_07685 [Sporosarcina sp. Marseille-Q4063]|uniref:hypothetical protein n=1 Tax=Sporosarcina sp. Marseille-Q4063 TaxID=2810514 RepID=UPI001BB0042C|nr:hypothetical protein [Sporosarcina sp. Marseille-Q4063]QUW23394.1 hypothetical protein JSQ81_07685 [Sporosarcina sp. Marseille-Q4063]